MLRTLVLLVCASLCGAAFAKHMFQYTDAQGVVHYTDVRPDEDVGTVTSTLVRSDAQPLIRLREDGTAGDRNLTFVNAAGGPVSVEVLIDEALNVRTEPSLPARIVLAPRSETRAVHVVALNPDAGVRYRFKYRYMPGDYRARPDDGAHYQLPILTDRQFRIAQAFGGKASHTDPQNYYAVDIGMPQGTPVLAARDGMVMTVDNDFYGAGLDMAKYGDRANNVRIVHADGTMAVYAHLQLESARVQVGDHVHAGQVLALSGDTGYSSGPHLHFCVQRNAGMELVSIPFRFTGPNGDFEPVAGMRVGGY
jgi:murein DD-endopeptidase MepM/ murein hydrolase activator NlpD